MESVATPRDPGTRANAIGLAVNVLLAVAKLVVGTIAGSAALVADGFNSAGDVLATTVATVGYVIGRQPPDENHHYGHGKVETVAGLIVGAMLLATGLFISIDGLITLLEGGREPPELLAAVVAAITVVTKEGLYRYVVRVGRRLNAPSLLASARDHRADVYAGVAVFAGVLGARTGLPWLDPLAAVIIGATIAWMAFEPVRENVGVLLDEVPAPLAEQIRFVARADEDVREVDHIRVHPLGSEYAVDFEIYVDGGLSLHAAHDIAHRVAERVAERVEHVRDVRVHVNPTGLRA